MISNETLAALEAMAGNDPGQYHAALVELVAFYRRWSVQRLATSAPVALHALEEKAAALIGAWDQCEVIGHDPDCPALDYGMEGPVESGKACDCGIQRIEDAIDLIAQQIGHDDEPGISKAIEATLGNPDGADAADLTTPKKGDKAILTIGGQRFTCEDFTLKVDPDSLTPMPIPEFQPVTVRMQVTMSDEMREELEALASAKPKPNCPRCRGTGGYVYSDGDGGGPVGHWVQCGCRLMTPVDRAIDAFAAAHALPVTPPKPGERCRKECAAEVADGICRVCSRPVDISKTDIKPADDPGALRMAGRAMATDLEEFAQWGLFEVPKSVRAWREVDPV